MHPNSTLPPQSSTLAEEELVSSLSWLIALRWPAGIGVVLATWFAAGFLGLNIPAMPLYLLGIGLLAYNVFLWWALNRLNLDPTRPKVIYQWFARFQIGLDWLAMTLLIHFSGGIESPAIFYFLFHITIASLLLPHDRGFLYVTLGPVLVGWVALLEYIGVLPHLSIFEQSRYNDPLYIGGVLFFFTSACYVMAYFSMTISHRLRRREDELAGLYQSVQAATSTLDITEVLNRLAEATTKALRCKGAAIRLLDKTGSYLEMTGVYGLSKTYMTETPIEVAYAPLDQEVFSGKTVLIPDATRDPRLRHPGKMAAEGIHALLSAPLIGKQGPIGVMRAYGGTTYHFTEGDAAFLSTIAAQGVVAIENAQAYQLLEELDQSKSQFIRIATHELRSPTRVTLSLLNVLERGYVGDLNKKQADLVDRARRRLQFLQTLIDDLLDLAAGKAEVLAPDKQSAISLNDVVHELYARFEAPAQDKGLALQLECPDEMLNIQGDMGELDRMVSNLVNNAIKYTPKGEVRLLLERVGDTVRIVVADTGIGIPKEAQPQLFEEFFRAKNAKEIEEAGTGLGLSIVKDLVERYNGTITVKSVENEGTTFTVTLPLAKPLSLTQGGDLKP